MLNLPAESNEFQRPKWLTQFNRSLRRARAAIRKEHTLALAARTFGAPLLLSALWIGLARFTMFDLPMWPALLFPVAWLLAVAIASSTHRVTLSESARFLDRHLGLDERVATCVQLLRDAPILGLKRQRPQVPLTLLEDTARQLRTGSICLPSGFNLNLDKRSALALCIPALLLLGAVFLPTPLDQFRADQAQLQQAVDEQIAKIETLRADLVARPGLDSASKALISEQLSSLEETLRNPPVDRSNLLAAISDTQSQLQQMSPLTPDDFAGVVAAAKTVQSSAINISRNPDSGLDADTEWDPDSVSALSDLGKAADAANVMSAWLRQLVPVQSSLLSTRLENAQSQALSENADLAKSLQDAANTVGARDIEQGRAALKATSDQFLAADKGFELAQAVQQSLADLDESRQTLAQAGAREAQKGQVGFRRSGAPDQSAAQSVGTPGGTETATDGSKSAGSQGQNPTDDHGVTTDSPSALGPNMGSNSPDYALPPPAQADGSGGTQSSSGGGGPPSSQTNGQGGNDQTGGSQQGSNGGQPGNVAGGGTGGAGGTFGGQVNGPVGGSGGAISQVANPAGQGVTTQQGGGPAVGNQDEQVYIPTPEESLAGTGSGSQAPGQAAPEAQNSDGIQGRGDGSGDGATAPGELGSGSKTEIHTPYKEVIGQYAEKASQALERTYVPTEAKEYVKDYFTELGK
jgi:hypothetical protein